MKKLADLKRQAKNFKWKMIYNSWFANCNELNYFRPCVYTDTVRLGLETIKENAKRISYLKWPKAKEVKIIKNDEGFIVEITRDCGDNKPHVMKYELQPV